jgi:NADH dehydrogenase/NADH:ubiquinone oxidoreductase subunit G
MSNLIFGPGHGFVLPASGTATKLADLSEVTVEETQEVVKFRGANKVDSDAAITGRVVSGTCKVFGLDTANLSLFVDGTKAAGSIRVMVRESSAIPETTWEVTVAESATFVDDLGVYNSTNSAYMTKVASDPTTGEYSVAAGVYQFAEADEADVVLISYSYTDTEGTKVTVANEATARGTFFKVYATNQYDGEATIYLAKVVFTKLAPLSTSKLNEYTQEYTASFDALADNSNNFYTLSTIAAS